MGEDDKKQYVNVLFELPQLRQVDDFRFDNRFESRTEAIRWLIQAALDKKLRPGVKRKKQDPATLYVPPSG